MPSSHLFNEAIYIRALRPALNKDGGRYQLSHTWDPRRKILAWFAPRAYVLRPVELLYGLTRFRLFKKFTKFGVIIDLGIRHMSNYTDSNPYETILSIY
ncbi:hypothetical protein DPMN_014493 [Dreissena polymorpha]|uniref:Uncharacterized protein n=1 Tax=Dreissena polymorpha TaxID=45954 RepID=A0A9D4NBT9_DREPO|nr:hypothetical protein DPMN_014493 [Dreissena polymorpha]